MRRRLQALPEDTKILIVFLTSLLTFGAAYSATATPTPEDRCRAAGYTSALHILQPDGQTREWLCYSLPSEDMTVPYRAQYLKEIP